jgi:tripartite-type tricarboxylate transporter receptor subunit TctC
MSYSNRLPCGLSDRSGTIDLGTELSRPRDLKSAHRNGLSTGSRIAGGMLAASMLLLMACTPKSPAAAPTAAKVAPTGAFNEQAVADFYKGKTVRLVVGSGPGGTFDTYSRLVATHMPRHLPGEPTIIVENRPGGGGLVAANTVYNVEPKDGTVLLSVAEDIAFQQLMGAEGIEFDASKYQWLGASVKGSYVCGARTDSGVNSFQDLLNGKPLIVGTSTPTSVVLTGPAVVVNGTMGTKMQIIPGYADFTRLKIAVEGQEVNAACGGWDGLVLVFGDLLDAGTFKVLYSLSELPADAQAVKHFQGLPTAESQAKTDEDRALIRAVNSPAQIAKPFAVVPGVPADRVAALRKAMIETYADAEFLAQAQQSKLAVSFSDGESVQRIVLDLLASPPAVRDRLKAIFPS